MVGVGLDAGLTYLSRRRRLVNTNTEQTIWMRKAMDKNARE